MALEQLIIEEVNIRHIEFVDDVSELMGKKAQPVFKNLGPKFGRQVNHVAEIIRGFSSDEIHRLEKGEKIHVTLDRGKHGDVEQDDVEIVLEAHPGLVVLEDSEITVALDTRLNEDLVAEGLAREFVNRVQNMRKDAGFQVTDRIRVFYEATPALRRAIRKKEDYIREEILSTSLDDGFNQGEYTQDWEIEREKIRIGIERVSD
jgi:isoleucyl-tRNA synthetase